MNIKKITLLRVAFVLISSSTIQALEKTSPKNQDDELGKVAWYKGYEQAVVLSAKENKAGFMNGHDY